jgi:rod shape-determining protein MreD
MAYLALLLAVLVDTAFQLLAPDRFGLQTAPPDLPLITALYIGFQARTTRGLGLAVVLGLLTDCFSSHPLGHFAFLFGAAAYAARGIRRYLPPDPGLSYVVACIFCALLTAFLALGMALVTVEGGAIGAGFARALLEAVASSLCAPFVFAFWDKSRLFAKAFGGVSYDFA